MQAIAVPVRPRPPEHATSTRSPAAARRWASTSASQASAWSAGRRKSGHRTQRTGHGAGGRRGGGPTPARALRRRGGLVLAVLRRRGGREVAEQRQRRGGDGLDRAFEGLGVRARGARRAADLADLLQCRGVHLVLARRRLEVVQGADAAAHGSAAPSTGDGRGRAGPGPDAIPAARAGAPPTGPGAHYGPAR